jgi:hypothetical protein
MKFTPHYSDNPSNKSSANGTDSANPSGFDGAIGAVARKEYLPYPVKQDWCADVKLELRKMGRGSQKKLLTYINSTLKTKHSTGHLSDILSGKYERSDIVGPVHEFLKWPAPLAPTASRDAGELAHIASRLTPEQRAFIETGRDRVAEMSGDEARAALLDMLDLLSPSAKTK